MAAIFLPSIITGSSVAWVRNSVHHTGIAICVGVTHPVESYTLPPSTPYVVVEQGDGSHLGPISRWNVVASELVAVQ